MRQSIREVCTGRRWNQRRRQCDVARAAGISQAALSKLEGRGGGMSLDRVERLLAALDLVLVPREALPAGTTIPGEGAPEEGP